MKGTYCRVEPLSPETHTADLFEAYAEAEDSRNWTYLSRDDGFANEAALMDWLEVARQSDDPLVHAIVDRATDKAVGLASYLRIEPAVGVIEVGSINYSPRLQRTPAGTEAMFLMMRRAFEELGYRRYEWKCDALNTRSRRAAIRFGFTYEGLFRQATMYKGRNRDTAWYSILDGEWTTLRSAYEKWLDPANFEGDGWQRKGLADLIAAARGAG